MRPPLLFRLYTTAATILVPFFAWIETRKVRRAGFSVPRAHEKLGHATDTRKGSGPLIWFHGASVGESMSVLTLIAEMGKLMPRAQFLLTSGTPTSAHMVADKLPPRTTHQFAPLDAPGPVKRFVQHWRPDGAVFVESELWPQMLRFVRQTGARMVLVNARLSDSSRQAWRKRPKTASFVLQSFDLILTQNDAMADVMIDIHAPADRVARGLNLKSLAAPLDADRAVLAQMRTALKGRPVWVAASTHRGEEHIVLDAHKRLLETHPDLLLLLAPRHPERGPEICRMVEDNDLSCAVRSKGALPKTEQVYIADTLGELGNWYALSKIIFLGGSLKPFGGHNPYEVALADAGVLSGPETFNFSETYAEMLQMGVARYVDDSTDLADAVSGLLDAPEALEENGKAARAYVRGKAAQINGIARRLIRALDMEDDLA
ncbi:MAG: glycosyltransferase N-terminal domain-containing protein [Pseudomonadota bacterium]